MRIKPLIRTLPAVGWMAIIFRLSAIPGSDLPGRFSTLAHFTTYGILGALLALALGRIRGPGETVAFATLLASAYAVSDEIHQSFVPMRTPDVSDWGVDTLGAFVGALVFVFALEAVRRRMRQVPESAEDQ